MAQATIDRPAAGHTALLLIDIINPLDFDDAADIRDAALAAGKVARTLRDAADAAGVPTIYVNDNFGQWHSERSALVDYARAQARDDDVCAGINALAPRDDDYFVIKPQFSGFYATNLPVLLPKLSATRVIVAGLAADICVLFTAADAHMRAYDLWVPGDAVASFTTDRTRWALEIMAQSMAAEVRPTSEVSLAEWLSREPSPPR